MWSELATVWGVCGGIGFGADLLYIRGHQKVFIHRFLTRMWIWLQSTKVPDMAAGIANIAISLVPPYVIRKQEVLSAHNLQALKVSWWSVLGAIIASVLLTTFAVLIGIYNWPYITTWSSALEHLMGRTDLWINVLIPNLPFDIATIGITLYALRIVAQGRTLNSVLAISADILLALLLMVGVVIVGAWFYTFMTNSEFLGIKTNLQQWLAGIKWLIDPDLPGARQRDIFTVVYSGTTFFPTACFLLVLLAALIAKPIAKIGRIAAVYILQSSREYSSAPESLPVGAMTGTLIATVLSIAIVLRGLLIYIRS